MDDQKKRLEASKRRASKWCKALCWVTAAELVILAVVYPDFSGIEFVTFFFRKVQDLFMLFWEPVATSLKDWYESFFAAPLLVWLLKLAAPAGVLVSLGFLLWRMFQLRRLAHPPVLEGKAVTLSQDRRDDAMAELDILQNTPVGDLFRGDKGVRIQVLTTAETLRSDRMDYIDHWNEDGFIYIPSLIQDIRLYYESNQAYIIGANAANGEFATPLMPGEPLLIQRSRQSDDHPVDRYTITWLGGY